MFEVLEHTADIGFRAHAASLKELFESAAEALIDIAMDTSQIAELESYAIRAEGDSQESLLVNWLNEVLYYIDGKRLAMRSFKVSELDAHQLRGIARGEPRHPQRHPGKLIVKGITYHQLKIERDEQGWYCEVYLDV